MKEIIVLGSTGSIGRQSLDIIKELGDYKVVALSANKNVDELIKEIEEFKPKAICVNDRVNELRKRYKDIRIYTGKYGLIDMIREIKSDTLLNALVGGIGLEPTLEGIRCHKKILLSNKETLVCGGEIVKEYLKKYNGVLYPIDSEHSGLWELISEYKNDIEEYYITASGGAFRDLTKKEMNNKIAKDALCHPTYKMGDKITVDSATMMNKGFEIIEAHYLFDIDYKKIHVSLCKDSCCHAYVKLKNGEYKYAVGDASMRNPIIRALYYPEIRYSNKEREINIDKLDINKYECLKLCFKAIKYGGINLSVLNSANDVLNEFYRKDIIKYKDYAKLLNKAINKFRSNEDVTLQNIKMYDNKVKEYINKLVEG